MKSVQKILIPKNAHDIVIFIHGFGVRWDARGVYTDIVEKLPKDFGSVLFDLYDTSDKDVYIMPIAEQVKRVKTMVQNIMKLHPHATVHLIAHSKGCIITSLSKIVVSGKVFFLAPPESFGTRLETYFKGYPGAKEENGVLIIPRKDGTRTHIPETYFSESKAIDAENCMNTYAKAQKIHLLQTTMDEVIGNTTYSLLSQNSNVSITQIAADHNFTGTHRKELISYIIKRIT